MGTALAAYRQCIGAEVVCHFHRQRKALRLPQIFEDEGGLAGGEVMLHLVVTTFFKCIAEIRIILYPAVQMTNGCSAG